MPWCPKCGTEYRDGITTCYNCGGQTLIDQPPQPKKPPQSEWERYCDEKGHDQPAFLQTVSSDMEADFVESLLRAYQIPLLRKYHHAGAYLHVFAGNSTFGVDLYVPASVLQQAHNILNAPNESITEELLKSAPPELREQEAEPDYDAQRLRNILWKLFTGLTLAVFVIVLLAQYAAQFIK